MRRALIFGITGQDSVYLAQLLISKNYKVYGTFRRASTPNFWRLMALNLEDKIELISVDLSDMSSIINAIQVAQPDEIYNMAASSYVADSFECPLANLDVTGMAVGRILESIRIINKNIKFYQSSSSEMYGNSYPTRGASPLHEESDMIPISPYGIAKLAAHHLVNVYRQQGMFAVSGILFNHESPLRGLDFVTRKITNYVGKTMFADASQDLVLGNLNAYRDWGFAIDYMEGVYLMMQLDEPGDYVLATNECHTVKEFAEQALDVKGLDHSRIKMDDRYKRPIDIHELRGDYHRIRDATGWEPRMRFKELVEHMVYFDCDRWDKWRNGEIFPWDAPLYPNEAQVLRRCQ